MATFIRHSALGSETVKPKGETFTLAEMQGYVEGYLEALQLSDGRVMWLNEEGKLDGLPFNPEANVIAHELTGIADWDMIVGNVLIATLEETEGDEDE